MSSRNSSFSHKSFYLINRLISVGVHIHLPQVIKTGIHVLLIIVFHVANLIVDTEFKKET